MIIKTWHKIAGTSALAMAVSLGVFFEGERLAAYQHYHDVPSICDGHTQGVKLGDTATHQQCMDWIQKEMQNRLDAVDRLTKVRQPDTRRAALADFAYNEGIGALAKSVALKDINDGYIVEGCLAMYNWERGNGEAHEPGLVLRRQADVSLCLEGTGVSP